MITATERIKAEQITDKWDCRTHGIVPIDAAITCKDYQFMGHGFAIRSCANCLSMRGRYGFRRFEGSDG